MVKPIDPFEGGELDGLQRSPRSAAADHLAFVETVDGLGEGVVIAVDRLDSLIADLGSRNFLPKPPRAALMRACTTCVEIENATTLIA